jgi:hypothetical protein
MNATTVTVSTLQQTVARPLARFPRERGRIVSVDFRDRHEPRTHIWSVSKHSFARCGPDERSNDLRGSIVAPEHGGNCESQQRRIERAATLIALGHVSRVSADTFAVRSQTTDDITYTVSAGTYAQKATGCDCVDAQRHPGQACKHQWAIDIVLVSEERQRRLDTQERFALLTETELGKLAEVKRHFVAA